MGFPRCRSALMRFEAEPAPPESFVKRLKDVRGVQSRGAKSVA